jgi:hypothetical protein
LLDPPFFEPFFADERAPLLPRFTEPDFCFRPPRVDFELADFFDAFLRAAGMVVSSY